MATKIIASYGDKKKIKEALGYSDPTIRKALNGEYNSDNTEEAARALRIREYALQIGGVECKRKSR